MIYFESDVNLKFDNLHETAKHRKRSCVFQQKNDVDTNDFKLLFLNSLVLFL